MTTEKQKEKLLDLGLNLHSATPEETAFLLWCYETFDTGWLYPPTERALENVFEGLPGGVTGWNCVYGVLRHGGRDLGTYNDRSTIPLYGIRTSIRLGLGLENPESYSRLEELAQGLVEAGATVIVQDGTMYGEDIPYVEWATKFLERRKHDARLSRADAVPAIVGSVLD